MSALGLHSCGAGCLRFSPQVRPCITSHSVSSSAVSRSARHIVRAAALQPLESSDAVALLERASQPELSTSDSDFCGNGQIMRRPRQAADVPAASRKSFHIHTMGCQMNLADSERMAGTLEAAGYVCTDSANEADVLIYNTCSIRDKAEQKVYSALGRQAKRKRNNMGDVKIVVAGCVAQQEGATLLRRVPEVDLVMGPQFANRIDELLLRVDAGSQVVATEHVDVVEDVATPRRDSTVTAWVNVIYGCNERCSYCVVPNTRGEEQSRTADAIRNEVLSLGEAGYSEVTLLGQNVDAYGRDLPGFAEDGSGRRAWTFTDLLHHIHDAPGIQRIRFATSHPRYFTERLVRACSELPKMCEFFHIPFQSGDNDILREMKRGYTHERYRNIIHNIRRYMPDASISGDAIVGFPGETEEQFQRTVQLVQEVGFDRVNTAAYSPRPNTPAAEVENQVADLVKMDRLNRLNLVVNTIVEERAQRFADRTLEVLCEGPNPRGADGIGTAFGRSRHNKLVFFDADGEHLRGKMCSVAITSVHAYTLYGNMVGNLSGRPTPSEEITTVL